MGKGQAMINKQTIISAYDEKLTLVQWLKLVNKALDDAVLTNVEIEQRGNATFVFVFTFEDGTQVESNEIIVNQGESIVDATIENGHLILTLSNGDELDAGNVKPVSSFGFNSSRHLIVYYGDGTSQDLGLIKGVSSFSIDANQHLIVYYDDGTSQDLGAIFDGNVSISGKFSQGALNNSFSLTLVGAGGIYSTDLEITKYFERAQVINNRLHVIVNIAIKNTGSSTITLQNGNAILSGSFYVTNEVGQKIIDFNGVSVSEVGTNINTLITTFKGCMTSGNGGAMYQGSFEDCNLYLTNRGNTRVDVLLVGNGATIPAGSKKYLSARVMLDLL